MVTLRIDYGADAYSALLTLHKARFDTAERQPDREFETTQKQLALMAIRSVINMVVSVAHSIISCVTNSSRLK